MADSLRIRRTPVQEQSRETAQRILDAAEALVGEAGVGRSRRGRRDAACDRLAGYPWTCR